MASLIGVESFVSLFLIHRSMFYGIKNAENICGFTDIFCAITITLYGIIIGFREINSINEYGQ